MTTSLKISLAYSDRSWLGHASVHERRHPKMSVNQEIIVWGITDKALNDSRHQIANDDKITDSDAKAFDRDCRIEDYGRIGVCDLGQGKERRLPSIQILCTA